MNDRVTTVKALKFADFSPTPHHSTSNHDAVTHVMHTNSTEMKYSNITTA